MRTFAISLTLILLFLVACGPATPSATTPPPAQPVRPTPTTDAALQPDSDGPVGYPPPLPSPTPYPEGYPIPPGQIEQSDPYPAAENNGSIFVLHPFGEQCEDAAKQKYPNAQQARAALTAAGITVYEVGTVDLNVCLACGCPTSAHYRAQIAVSDLNKALALGWTQE